MICDFITIPCIILQCCQSVGFYPNTMDFRCPNSGYGFVPVNVRIFVGSPITYIFT